MEEARDLTRTLHFGPKGLPIRAMAREECHLSGRIEWYKIDSMRRVEPGPERAN